MAPCELLVSTNKMEDIVELCDVKAVINCETVEILSIENILEFELIAFGVIREDIFRISELA